MVLWNYCFIQNMRFEFFTAELMKIQVFFLWWRAPQQMLRTHRSLKAAYATLWWRWKMISFTSLLQAIEHQWNEIERGKPKYSGEKPVPAPLCPLQIPHGLTRDFFCPGFFPFWSIFVLFKSFRSSCHFTFHINVLTTNTTHTQPCRRWNSNPRS